MNYVEVAIPFFILAIALEFLYGLLAKKQTYRINDTVNSLSLGVLSRLVDILRLGFAGVVLGTLAQWMGLPQWSMSSAWQWVAAFVAYDFCYYWKHRYGHEWRIMWASHIAHHQSEEFNLSTALRQTGTDYIGFVFYIPLYLAGIPAAVVITVGSLNLIYQFWVHTEHIRRLGPLELIFVTPSNHRVHHARNPEYIDRNYGGVFIVWDRLFGTFEDERADLPCVYGITTGLKSWNPVWANLHFWADTARLAWRTRRWSDKLKIWFKPPAWYPADLDPHQSIEPNYPKYDPPTAAFTRAYIFVQFWLMTAASLWLLAAQGHLPRAFVLMLFVWISFSLYVQGTWLEGRPYARSLEWVRIAITLGMAAGA
jgi:sterol desaturase/sphingolipid hydroxylase (fatty acid hydroxylase superfamily)